MILILIIQQLLLLVLLQISLNSAEVPQLHRNGYCAMYNQSVTGVPLFYNQLAREVSLNSLVVVKIRDLCGPAASDLLNNNYNNLE